MGVRSPLTEYIKFLPDELLPTFWSAEEKELLSGTTLEPAVRAKLNSLLREFEMMRTTTESIDWCNKHWWDEDTGKVTFDDWMCVDAMYRSRALEFPGVGDCKLWVLISILTFTPQYVNYGLHFLPHNYVYENPISFRSSTTPETFRLAKQPVFSCVTHLGTMLTELSSRHDALC